MDTDEHLDLSVVLPVDNEVTHLDADLARTSEQGTAKVGFDVADKRWRVGTNTVLIMFAALQAITVGLLADLMVRLTRTRERVDPADR